MEYELPTAIINTGMEVPTVVILAPRCPINPRIHNVAIANVVNGSVTPRMDLKLIKKINEFKRSIRGLNIDVIDAPTTVLTEKLLLAYFGSKRRGLYR